MTGEREKMKDEIRDRLQIAWASYIYEAMNYGPGELAHWWR
jgi:hypothetical protein